MGSRTIWYVGEVYPHQQGLPEGPPLACFTSEAAARTHMDTLIAAKNQGVPAHRQTGHQHYTLDTSELHGDDP